MDPKFSSGQKIKNTRSNKIGIIRRLRDDTYEQKHNHPGIYYYCVDYDDGTFETYEYEKYLEKI